jgi:hypothetical protein
VNKFETSKAGGFPFRLSFFCQDFHLDPISPPRIKAVSMALVTIQNHWEPSPERYKDRIKLEK